MDCLTEAFKQLDCLNEDTFEVNNNDTKALGDFIAKDEEVDEVQIADLNAETEEDLEDSYIGKVIIQCDVCKSMLYKDPSEIEIDNEKELVNVGEECPYCFSSNGFKVIGEVAPYAEFEVAAEDDDGNDIDVDLKLDGKKIKNVKKVSHDSEDDSEDDTSEDASADEASADEASEDEENLDDDLEESYLNNKLNEVKDLSKVSTSMTSVLSDNRIWQDAKTPKELADIIENIFADNGIDTKASNRLLANIRSKKSLTDANYTVYNSILAGSGDTVIQPNRENEEFIYEPVNEGLSLRRSLHKKIKKNKNFNEKEILDDTANEVSANEPIEEALEIDTTNAKYSVKTALLETWQEWEKIPTVQGIADFVENLVDIRGINSKTAKEITHKLRYEEFEDANEAKIYLKELLANNINKMRESKNMKRKYYFNYNEGTELTESKYDSLLDELEQIAEDSGDIIGESLDESINSVELKVPAGQSSQRISVEAVEDASDDFEDEAIQPLSAGMEADIGLSDTPAEDFDEESEEPIEPAESEEPIEPEEGDEVEAAVDEIDEENTDNLGESFLTKVYSNVKSFKTISATARGNTLKLEGVIRFKSGKKKNTSFIFEAATINKNGKIKFIGENADICRGKKAFVIAGSLKNNKFIPESLTYNYRAKSLNENMSKRVYGTVRVN